MAKGSGISKKLLAKKDMNFFAEFTANAAKAARMLGYGVAAGFLVVFIVLTFIIAFFIRNTFIKTQIRDLENLLASPEYSGLEQEAALLTEQLNDMTNYYYALTQMRQQVDVIDPVNTELPDVIAQCIPSDSYLFSYSINNSQMNMKGYSFTYYSPVDMVNMLNSKNVFATRPMIHTERVELDEGKTPEEIIAGGTINAINNYYLFEISGYLVSKVHVSVSRFAETPAGSKTLGGVENIPYGAGDPISIDGISAVNYAGVDYTLTRITVNGIQVEEGSFNAMKEANTYSDVAHSNMDIVFYYATVEAAPAEG